MLITFEPIDSSPISKLLYWLKYLSALRPQCTLISSIQNMMCKGHNPSNSSATVCNSLWMLAFFSNKQICQISKGSKVNGAHCGNMIISKQRTRSVNKH